MSERFVNRRGQAADIDFDGVELPAIEQPVAGRPARRRRRLRLRWPLLMAGLGVLIGLLALAVGLGEMVAAQYRADSQRPSEVVRRVGQASLAAEAPLASLDQSIGELQRLRDDMCRGGMLDNAAQLYPRARSGLGDCTAAKQQVSQLVSGLETQRQQAAYLEVLGKALAAVSDQPSDGQFAVLNAQQTSWNRIKQDLGHLTAPGGLADIHQTVKQEADAIQAAWIDLNQAAGRQDGAAFAKSQDELKRAYAAFRDVQSSLRERLLASQAEVTASYRAITG